MGHLTMTGTQHGSDQSLCSDLPYASAQREYSNRRTWLHRSADPYCLELRRRSSAEDCPRQIETNPTRIELSLLRLDDAAAGGAGAGEEILQLVALAPADVALEGGEVLAE